jgi:hypothetical protein
VKTRTLECGCVVAYDRELMIKMCEEDEKLFQERHQAAMAFHQSQQDLELEAIAA